MFVLRNLDRANFFIIVLTIGLCCAAMPENGAILNQYEPIVDQAV
jgi:hypothetical protein